MIIRNIIDFLFPSKKSEPDSSSSVSKEEAAAKRDIILGGKNKDKFRLPIKIS